MIQASDTNNVSNLIGTKAEVLYSLRGHGFNVPKVYFFTVKDWNTKAKDILNEIQVYFSEYIHLAIRSSNKSEDTVEASMAGAFVSVLNINIKDVNEIRGAIEKVISSYDEMLENQILVQPMVADVAVSGVAMTKVLDDGSPYYVINYDDKTGLTDTVTNGMSINKTVFIYNGVKENDFDSVYLKVLLRLIWDLESTFPDIPLDVEFAIDKDHKAYLLQVRRITTLKNWKKDINDLVSSKIKYLAEYVENLMASRDNLGGDQTLLGIMPDWNPAEMIGVVPHPLAMSLYRELITKKTWYTAREKMGYRKMPHVELMVSLFGRAYIDVRNSINSFMPEGLDSQTCNKLVNACLKRLEQNPHLHDKIEFEVVPTAFDFNFDKNFKMRYPDVLEKEEFQIYKSLLRKITREAIRDDYDSSLNVALRKVDSLQQLQEQTFDEYHANPFSLSDRINTLLSECIEYGTLPFSIIARHGFIAESLLRSAIANEAMEEERVYLFKRSIKTIASQMGEDFFSVCTGSTSKEDFLKQYGHIRPSSYDILSPAYKNRKDLFEGIPQKPQERPEFVLHPDETRKLNILLAKHGFDGIHAEELLLHAQKAIVGREYAKFIFTRHLSVILELIANWGESLGFSREDMAMLTLEEILSILIAPLTDDVRAFYKPRIEDAVVRYDLASSFKLSYLIRSTSDIYVVPQQRSTSNFVGHRRIEAEVVLITPYLTEIPDLTGKIVCIEGADPGYDWVFSREIGGLVTKYGGANSHMAIRCAEYNLPAAIGCGEQPFERILEAGKCLLDCQVKRLEPLSVKFD